MNLDQRVLHGTDDISDLVNDYRSGAYVFPYEIGQYLYIGSILPFNNLWIEIGIANAIPAAVTPQIWWGGSDGWVNAVDILDQTVGLTLSGRLQWNTDIDKGWQTEQRAKDVTGLESISIYNMYWMRFAWNVNLTPTMTLKYIGQKFSNDSVLASFYPDLCLSDTMNAFKVGKTSWEEQHYMAAEHIIRDLKKRDIIKSRGQLLDYSLFIDAACHKVAEIAYASFGQPYFDQYQAAGKRYSEALNIKFFNTDKNADGRLDPVERSFKTDFVTR